MYEKHTKYFLEKKNYDFIVYFRFIIYYIIIMLILNKYYEQYIKINLHDLIFLYSFSRILKIAILYFNTNI